VQRRNAVGLQPRDFLEAFIGAKQRGHTHKRGPHGWRNQALANRLPRWMQSAGQRADVLRCLAALRQRLAEAA
jgi:hypothetical protein